MPDTHGVNSSLCGRQTRAEAHLKKGLQGLLALLHASLHVEAASIDDLIGHVNLHLLDVVAHQGLYAVCILPLPWLCLLQETVIMLAAFPTGMTGVLAVLCSKGI